MGYGLATLCLHFPNYLFMRDFYIPTSHNDPRYLGNWWLGFLIIGIVLVFLSIPLWFFPRFLPKKFIDKEGEGKEEEEKSDDYVGAVTQGLKSFESQSSHGFLRGRYNHMIHFFLLHHCFKYVPIFGFSLEFAPGSDCITKMVSKVYQLPVQFLPHLESRAECYVCSQSVSGSNNVFAYWLHTI